MGLRGSRAYVEKHKQEISESLSFVVNIDIAGDPLGLSYSKVTGDMAIKNYLDSVFKVKGMQLDSKRRHIQAIICP
jgi:hypothetical protein